MAFKFNEIVKIDHKTRFQNYDQSSSAGYCRNFKKDGEGGGGDKKFDFVTFQQILIPSY